MNDLVYFRVDQKDKQHIGNEMSFSADISNQLDDGSLASDFYVINPVDINANKPLSVSLRLKRSAGAFESAQIYKLSNDYTVMTKLNAEVSGEQVKFSTRQGGTYVAKYEKNYSVLIGVLVGVTLLAVVIASVAIFLFKNPKYLQRIRYTAYKAKQSTQSEI